MSRMSTVGVSVALAATLAGCTATPSAVSPTSSGSSAASYTPLFASAPCPDPNLPGVPAANLGPEYSCGFLTVPEDRAKPQGRSVRLAVARVKAVAANPPPDPIVYLDGGPGAAALVSAPSVVALGINAARDVIFLDQRGTYHSEPKLTCPEVDAFLTGSVSQAFSTPEAVAASNAATTACHDRLAKTGVDLAAYDTAANSRDVADLRVALGIKEWNVYGVSYGTDLALSYLRDHPTGIRSVVLDSVAPPNLDLITNFWPASAGGYQAVFDACAAQPACAGAYPDLANEFTATVNRLSTTPLIVPVTSAAGQTVQVAIDGYQLANMVSLAIATRASAGVPLLIHQLAHGDGTAAAAMLLGMAPLTGLTGYGLQWGAFCREVEPQSSPQKVLAKGRAALPGWPDAVLSMPPQVPRFFSDCAIWNVGTAPTSQRAPTVSDVPVLFLGGTFDAVTSPTWIPLAAATLKNAQSVLVPGAGHQVLHTQPCGPMLVRAFFARPGAPVDQTCVKETRLPTFTTP